MCRANEGGFPRVSPLPLLSGLRDRAPARRDRQLHPVLRPPRSRLRLGPRPRRVHARADRRWAALALAVRAAPARRSARRAAPRAGLHAARPCSAPRCGDRRGRALAEARHGEPHPLLQGPRRRGRRPEGAGARADDPLVLLDRQPRGRRRGARGRRGSRGGGVRAGGPRAREARRGGCVRAEALRRRRPLRPLLAAVRRAVVRAALGLRQREPPLVLCGGLEDARVRDRRAARLVDARRHREPDRLRRAVPQGRAGALRAAGSSGWSTALRRDSSGGRPRAASRSRPRSARARR